MPRKSSSCNSGVSIKFVIILGVVGKKWILSYFKLSTAIYKFYPFSCGSLFSILKWCLGEVYLVVIEVIEVFLVAEFRVSLYYDDP